MLKRCPFLSPNYIMSYRLFAANRGRFQAAVCLWHTRTFASKANVYLWENLPGENNTPRKGVEKLLGKLRAERFAQTHPAATTPIDRYDVVIGPYIQNSLL